LPSVANAGIHSEAEVVTGDVADDLADTYSDVKAGLLLLERGDAEGALWHWIWTFKLHWGTHVVNALHALHTEP
jgi:hypothetical protein